jgi:hypothetical protein
MGLTVISLVALGAFALACYGWGSTAYALFYPGRDPSHAYIVTLGLAVLAFMGGVLNAIHAIDSTCLKLRLCWGTARRFFHCPTWTQHQIAVGACACQAARMGLRHCDHRFWHLPNCDITANIGVQLSRRFSHLFATCGADARDGDARRQSVRAAWP